jgi:hypothetical protein
MDNSKSIKLINRLKLLAANAPICERIDFRTKDYVNDMDAAWLGGFEDGQSVLAREILPEIEKLFDKVS